MSLSIRHASQAVGCKTSASRLCTSRSVRYAPVGSLHSAIKPTSRKQGSWVTAAAAAAAIDAPTAPPAKEGWWQKDCPPNMKDVVSVQELVDELAANKDRLVVVDFYASWCHSCRSIFPKFKKLVGGNPDILVLKVNFDENKQMCKTLGIKVLPYFHMYKGAEGRVEAFTASINKIQRLKDALEVHGAPFCSLGSEDPTVPEFPDVKAHAAAGVGQSSHTDVELLDGKTARQTVKMNQFNSFPGASAPAFAA